MLFLGSLIIIQSLADQHSHINLLLHHISHLGDKMETDEARLSQNQPISACKNNKESQTGLIGLLEIQRSFIKCACHHDC